ncbi:MAG: hypothetical protein E6I88_00145 [Chloroflexi bacterium]|nr:MAG: hypothetical protein E6I88_00145 [Chloroflexota bacterium]
MAEIKHQQPGGSPEVSGSVIHIPNDADMGTGTFTTEFKSNALPATKVIMSAIVNAPVFQITATVNWKIAAALLDGKPLPTKAAPPRKPGLN